MRAILLNQAVCALYLVTVWSSALSAVITRPPGELTVLDGATLSLTWHVSASDADIKWCYWRFRPDNDLSKPWLKLLGWDNINKEVIPYDDGGPGDWEVIGEQPCSTGVRARSTADYQGTYQYGLIQQDGIEHVSQPLTVTVKQDTQLFYDITIGDHHYYPMINSPSKNVSAANNVTAGDKVALSAALDWADDIGDFSFHKVVSGHNEILLTCQGVKRCATEMDLDDDEDDVGIVVNVVPSMQGSQPMTLTQSVLVIPAESSTNITAIVLGVLFAICAVFIILLFLAFYWRGKGHTKPIFIMKLLSDSGATMPKLDVENRPDQGTDVDTPLLHDCKEEELQKQIKSLETLLEANERNREILRQEYEDDKNKVIDDKDAEIKALNEQLQETDVDSPQSPNNVEELQEQIKLKQTELDVKTKKNTDLTHDIQQKDGQLHKLNEQVKNLNEANSSLKTTINQMQQDNIKHLKTLDEKDGAITEKDKKIKELEKQIKAANQRDMGLAKTVQEKGFTATTPPITTAVTKQPTINPNNTLDMPDEHPTSTGQAPQQTAHNDAGDAPNGTETDNPPESSVTVTDAESGTMSNHATTPSDSEQNTTGEETAKPSSDTVNSEDTGIKRVDSATQETVQDKMRQLDELIATFDELRKKYELPSIKEQVQAVIDEITKEITNIDLIRPALPYGDPRSKLQEYKRVAQDISRECNSITSDCSPTTPAYAEHQRIDPTLKQMMEYKTRDVDDGVLLELGDKIKGWNDLVRKIGEKETTTHSFLPHKIKGLIPRLERADRKWKDLKTENAHLLHSKEPDTTTSDTSSPGITESLSSPSQPPLLHTTPLPPTAPPPYM